MVDLGHARKLAKRAKTDLSDLAIRSPTPEDYVERVNRAIDHVTRHLAEPLRLGDVAKVACFSPHHFHRVFRSVMKETLHDFVHRLRLERAIFLMARAKQLRLTDVALQCGFGSSSDFSRSFKTMYGVPPRSFDVAAHTRAGRARLMEGFENGHRLARLPPGQNPDRFRVRLRELPARRVAYLRVTRPYEWDRVVAACERMKTWARARGLSKGQWLGYQWDTPDVVPLERCRYDVGLVVPEGAVVGGGVSVVRFPPMTVAEVAMVGSFDLETRAVDWLYGTWLPRSGYAPAHQPMFEAWDGEPLAHGMTEFHLRLHLAVSTGA
jgi:AraC family transcriptional regulator